MSDTCMVRSDYSFLMNHRPVWRINKLKKGANLYSTDKDFTVKSPNSAFDEPAVKVTKQA